jgi:hypothetical protein
MLTTIRYLYKHGNIEIDCELEFDPAQAGNETDPAWPAQAFLISATVDGADVLPLLRDTIIADIEEGAIWSQD